MYGHGMFNHGFFMPGMLFWLVILGLIVWAIISLSKKSKTSSAREKAEDIISERYAKGEISAEEFDVMLEKLSK